jgi:hypothetical protein
MVAKIWTYVCPKESPESNARLIAAAPDLLQALETIERTLADHPDIAIENSKVHFVFHAARTAIVTAKGE